MNQAPKKIFLIDDDDIEIGAFTHRLRRRELDIPVIVAKDGREALQTIRSVVEEDGKDSGTKYLIVLDINMPGMDGHEFLEELRKDDMLKRCLVFVYSSSDFGDDIERAYNKNVAGYFLKENCEDLLDTIAKYTQSAQLPSIGQVSAHPTRIPSSELT